MLFEQYIAGFHNLLDKISTLNIDNKVKGYLLLRQASLLPPAKNFQVGPASGIYNILHFTTALRNFFINQSPPEATLNTQYTPADSNNCRQVKLNNRNVAHPLSTIEKVPERPIFSYKSTYCMD